MVKLLVTRRGNENIKYSVRRVEIEHPTVAFRVARFVHLRHGGLILSVKMFLFKYVYLLKLLLIDISIYCTEKHQSQKYTLAPNYKLKKNFFLSKLNK